MDDEKKTGGERINVTIGGRPTTAVPAAPSVPAEPEAPPEPAEPEAPPETPVEPEVSAEESEPAPKPPAPGTVVTSGDGSIGGPPTPPPAVVTGKKRGKGKGWLKALTALIVIAALIVAGWFIYQHYGKKQQAAPATARDTSIPLLKIGIYQGDYGKLYPDMGVSEYGYLVNAQMFEGLVRYEDKSKIVPTLASTWTNPDSKTWIFTLKQGVKFHDGHTMTAKDVKYSFDKIIASKGDLAETFASTISSVETVGNDKVKITTTDPDPSLLNKLTFLYVIDSNLPKGDEPSQAGTGPYEIKPGTTPTSTNVQMVAFNGYHGGTPTTKALDFGSSSDTATLAKALQNHQYDIVGPLTAAEEKNSGGKKFVTSEPDVSFIAFNTVKPGPLQKQKVREAIRYAINAAAIGQAHGIDVTPISQLIPPSIPGYDPAINPYKQDITKAKQLLDQAGYSKGLTLRFSSAESKDEIDETAKQLKQVGINLTIDYHKDFNEFIDYFTSGKAEMYDADYTSDTLDGLDIFSTVLPDFYYNNPKFTAKLDEAGDTTDPAQRLKLLQDATGIVDKDVPVVPEYTQNDLYLTDKDYVMTQDMPSSLLSVYFYKVHQK
jgi:peptide/nickel transport system substrate-binding protein